VKLKLADDSVAFAPEVTPMPSRPYEWGLPSVLSFINTAADRGPRRVGLNVAESVQLPEGGMEVPHVFPAEKSAGAEPVLATLRIMIEDEPLLVRVKV